MVTDRYLPALAVTLILVACSVLGCGGSEQAPDGTGSVKAADQQRPAALPGAPPREKRPSTSKLDPDLRAAVEAARRDARAEGVPLEITSGWRSRAHQQRLYDEAVRTYGSEEEASRYVSTPDVSAHVTGDAVDIGPTEATVWLIEHGADYGLCQIFANETWHFELATTPGGRCPDLLPDGSWRN